MLKKYYYVLLFLYSTIQAAPAQVLIIRHAEKPTNAKDINLSMRGYQRSYALVPLFANMPLTESEKMVKNAQSENGGYILPALYGQPVALYAKGQQNSASSIRPIMTLTPLAKQLSLEIKHHITENKYDKKKPGKYAEKYLPLVNDIMNNVHYNDKVVLICWEHNAIPTITQAFFIKATDGIKLPKHLRNSKIFDNFDRIFRLTFKRGKITHFDNLAQELLVNDACAITNEFYTLHEKMITRCK